MHEKEEKRCFKCEIVIQVSLRKVVYILTLKQLMKQRSNLNVTIVIQRRNHQTQCNFRVSQKVDLWKLVKSFHEENSLYKCSIFNQVFQYKVDLKRNTYERMHNEKK